MYLSQWHTLKRCTALTDTMRVLLVLTAGSAALPGNPRALPALKLRGGGVQQTLDALPHDAKALAASFVVLGGFDKFVQYLAASETISRPAARKTMHVGAGPLFLLCWPVWNSTSVSGTHNSSISRR